MAPFALLAQVTVADEGAIPLWLKIAHTLFVSVLVPVYWRIYGPANFLWFSDIALFVTTIALWLESPLLASTQAIAVATLETVWLVEFLLLLVAGVRFCGIAAYMFQSDIPLVVRCLSLFHVWLPFLLPWLVWRLGYDSRALYVQSIVCVVVLLVCYCFTDRAANINWAFGPGEKPQTRLAPRLYLVLVMAAFIVGVYVPTHLLLLWLFPAAPGR